MGRGPQRDAILVALLLAALFVHFRGERQRLDGDAGYQAAIAFLSADSTAAAAIGGPLAPRFGSRRQTEPGTLVYNVGLGPPLEATRLKVEVDSSEDGWEVRELVVYHPESTAVLDWGYPDLPDGPRRPPTLADRAERAYRDGRLEEARALLSQAIERDPGSAHAYVVRGWLYQARSRWGLALRDFERAYRLDPRNYEAAYGYGLELGRQGRYRESIDILTRTIALDPDRSAAYYVRAVTLGKIDDEVRQIADLRAACTRGSDQACTVLDRHGVER